MSYPFGTYATGRTRSFVMSGEFTWFMTSQFIATSTGPGTPRAVYGYLTGGGYAELPGVFKIDFPSNPIGSVPSYSFDFVTINSTAQSVDFGSLDPTDYDTLVTWKVTFDASEFVTDDTVGGGLGSLSTIEKTEAEYLKVRRKFGWRIQSGGSWKVELTVNGADNVFTGTFSSSGSDSFDMSPTTGAGYGAWIQESDDYYPEWTTWVGSADYLATMPFYAKLTSPWGVDDDASETISVGPTGISETMTANLGGGMASVDATIAFSAFLATEGWGDKYGSYTCSAYACPKLEVQPVPKLRYRNVDHSSSPDVFTLQVLQGPLLDIVADTRTSVGSTLQTFLKYDFRCVLLDGGRQATKDQFGAIHFSIDSATLKSLCGGSSDTRVFMRGKSTDALSLSRTSSHTFFSGTWSALTTTSKSATLTGTNRNVGGFRWFQVATTGVPDGTLLTAEFGNTIDGGTIGKYQGRVVSGNFVFDACANINGVVSERVATSPSIVTVAGSIRVLGLPVGASLGAFSGITRDSIHVATARLAATAIVKSEGRFVTTGADGAFQCMGTGTDFISCVSSAAYALAGKNLAFGGYPNLTATVESYDTSTHSAGDLYRLGGAGIVYDWGSETWVDQTDVDLPCTLQACELFEYLSLWPKTGNPFLFTDLDGTPKIPVAKILGAWAEGTVSTRKSQDANGLTMTATLLDDSSTLDSQVTQSHGTYLLDDNYTPASSEYGTDISHLIRVKCDSASTHPYYDQAWVNRKTLWTFFILGRLPGSAGRGLSITHDAQGQFHRAHISEGIVVHSRSLFHNPTGYSMFNLGSASSVDIDGDRADGHPLVYVFLKDGSGYEARSYDDGETVTADVLFTGEDAVLCVRTCRLPEGERLRAWSFDAGGTINIKVQRVMFDGSIQGPWVVGGTSPVAFEASDFDITGDKADSSAILSAFKEGDDDPTDFVSHDDGETWSEA